MRRHLQPDERGTNTVVTHVLAIGISTLLVLGILLAGSSYIQDQREISTQEELNTIGNRLASEVSQLDDLRSQGGNVSMVVEHPRKIAGSTYDVRVASGAECDTSSFSTPRCLVLTPSDIDTVERIPIRIDNDVEIRQVDPGRFRLVPVPNGASAGTLDENQLSVPPLRVGIGSDVEPDTIGSISDPTNREPIAKMEVIPGFPTSLQGLTFDASDSRDVDGTITEYHWEFGNGDNRTVTAETTGYNYSNPGPRRVNLTVVDDDGANTTISKNVSISGLVYRNDLEVPPGQDRTLRFSMRNNWSSSITVESMRINPYDDDIDRLNNGGSPEILIGGTAFQLDDIDDKRILEDGLVVRDENVQGGAFSKTFAPGATQTFELRRFSDFMEDETVEVTVSYTVRGRTNTSQFVDDTFSLTGGWEWAASSDWDASTREQGVVHEAFSDDRTDADEVEMGYPNYDETGSDLVAYYPLDEQRSATGWPPASPGYVPPHAKDVTLNGNNATLENENRIATLGGNHDTDSLFLQEVFGSNGYLTVDSTNRLSGGPDATFSVGAWFNLTDIPSGDGAIVAKERNKKDGDWGLVATDSCPSNCNGPGPWVGFYAEDGGNDYWLYTSVDEDEWSHAMFTFDQQTEELKLFVDGTLAASDDNFGQISASTAADVEIGETTYQNANVAGNIEDVRIYDRVLSDDEAIDEYDNATSATLVTDWRSDTNVSLNSLELDYAVDIDAGEAVSVKVQGDRDGDSIPDFESNDLGLSDGSNTQPVTGSGQTSDTYRLVVTLDTTDRTTTPTVDSLELDT
jgi:hypothetical protein